jgi:hypothetical protein
VDDFWFESDDPAITPGWSLLEFLILIGADEFRVSFLYVSGGGGGQEMCDRLFSRLEFALIGERVRECTVTAAGASNPRPVEVWRLDVGSLGALCEIMPAGVMGPAHMELASAEDLSVYRQGQLLFGTVSHEQIAFARLTEEEWEQWNAWSAAHR